MLANRLNYRNHRKIIVIDGYIGYVGGINVSDKYVNQQKNKLFWRDTHLKIVGTSVVNLQFVFLTDWNFCANQTIGFSEDYFPLVNGHKLFGDQLIQIVSSGPDSQYPSIKFTLIQAILRAKDNILITTPYFIPDKSFLDAVLIAAISGVKVKLLMPGVSDSFIVNTTSQSYYQELLDAGVEIYAYTKGFVHAKTMVCDEKLAIIGTANLDNRSFDLNFEINAMVYDEVIAKQLAGVFKEDISISKQISSAEWRKRPLHRKFMERLLNLFSSLM
jgi:cardiolipin synthase